MVHQSSSKVNGSLIAAATKCVVGLLISAANAFFQWKVGKRRRWLFFRTVTVAWFRHRLGGGPSVIWPSLVDFHSALSLGRMWSLRTQNTRNARDSGSNRGPSVAFKGKSCILVNESNRQRDDPINQLAKS